MSTASASGLATIVDRMGLKTLVESCLVLEEGVASAKDIEVGMMMGAGILPGPFARADDAGLDTILAARQVGPSGRVIGVDMTPAMLEKARGNATRVGLTNVEFREGLTEALPVPDEFADVIISNGVINLCPDKDAVYCELFRVLKPGGRLQIADIVVTRPVPQDAREDIDLWTG